MIAKARRASAAGATITYDNLTPALIEFLADFYLATELAADDQLRWGRPPPKPRYASRPDIEQDYEDSREMLSGYQGVALQSLWGEWLVQYAADMGYSINPADPAFGNLLEAIASAACNLWLAIDSRRDAAKGEATPIDTPSLWYRRSRSSTSSAPPPR